MRPTPQQITTVTCLVDLGYSWSTIWHGGMYELAYPIVVRLMATKGQLDDALYDHMPAIQREMTLIVADWMSTVYKRLEQ